MNIGKPFAALEIIKYLASDAPAMTPRSAARIVANSDRSAFPWRGWGYNTKRRGYSLHYKETRAYVTKREGAYITNREGQTLYRESGRAYITKREEDIHYKGRGKHYI